MTGSWGRSQLPHILHQLLASPCCKRFGRCLGKLGLAIACLHFFRALQLRAERHNLVPLVVQSSHKGHLIIDACAALVREAAREGAMRALWSDGGKAAHEDAPAMQGLRAEAGGAAGKRGEPAEPGPAT